MVKRFLSCLLIAPLIFGGCSIKSPDEVAMGGSVTVQTLESGEVVTTYNGNAFTTQAMAQAQQNCLLYHREMEMEKWKAVAGLENEIYKTFAVMHADSMAMVRNTFGKDLCSPGTNEFDAYIAYAENQGAIQRQWISSGLDLAKTAVVWGFGAYAVGKAFDAAGDSIGGDKITSGDSTFKNVEGMGDYSSTSTESNLTQSQRSSSGDNNLEPANNFNDNREMAPPEEVEEFPVESEADAGLIEINELEIIE